MEIYNFTLIQKRNLPFAFTPLKDIFSKSILINVSYKELL